MKKQGESYSSLYVKPGGSSVQLRVVQRRPQLLRVDERVVVHLHDELCRPALARRQPLEHERRLQGQVGVRVDEVVLQDVAVTRVLGLDGALLIRRARLHTQQEDQPHPGQVLLRRLAPGLPDGGALVGVRRGRVHHNEEAEAVLGAAEHLRRLQHSGVLVDQEVLGHVARLKEASLIACPNSDVIFMHVPLATNNRAPCRTPAA